jgi:hypothetical protein
MLELLSKWFEQRQRKRAAVAAAVRYFEAVSGKSAHHRISSVIGEKDDQLIVRVCHGHTKPPGRSWFLVARDGSITGELSFADVQVVGGGYWR